MTKARQDATIKKIERNVGKLIPETADPDFLVDGYEDQMGENIKDLESEPEENGDGNQRPAPNEGNERAEPNEQIQREEACRGNENQEVP